MYKQDNVSNIHKTVTTYKRQYNVKKAMQIEYTQGNLTYVYLKQQNAYMRQCNKFTILQIMA